MEVLLDSKTAAKAVQGPEKPAAEPPKIAASTQEATYAPTAFTFPNEIVDVQSTLISNAPAPTKAQTQTQSQTPTQVKEQIPSLSPTPTASLPAKEPNQAVAPPTAIPEIATASKKEGAASALPNGAHSALRQSSRTMQAALKNVRVSPGRLPKVPMKTTPRAAARPGTGTSATMGSRKMETTASKPTARVPAKAT